MAEETMTPIFIHSIIEEELQPGGRQVGNRFTPGSHRSPTVSPHRPLQGADH